MGSRNSRRESRSCSSAWTTVSGISNDILPATLQIFVNKKDAFYRIIDELEPATKRTRRQVHSYLEGFYEELSNPSMVQERLVAQCYVPVADLP